MNEKQCSRCEEIKSKDQFCKWSRSKDGLQPACKKCMNVSWNASRKKKKEHYQQVQLLRRRAVAEQVSLWKAERGCVACGERYSKCLELHHLDPKEKELDPADTIQYSWTKFLEEASKCIVVCANCHRKIHGGALVLDNLGVA